MNDKYPRFMSVWKNNKTGNNYRIIGIAKDANNNGTGEPQVIYHLTFEDAQIYYRHPDEFIEQFTWLRDY